MEQNKGKIKIFTFSKGDNYGAVLQSYSLATILRNLNYDVEFIYYTWTTWKYAILSHITPLGIRFEHFRKVFLRSFSRKCLTSNDLLSVCKDADLCIVGSDQVWNPLITGNRALHYFFDFLPDQIKRISYAASFGNSEWEYHELDTEIKELLKKFDFISVRESEGVEICKRWFNCNALKVLDPTLLLGNFDNLLVKPKMKNAILGFKFVPDSYYYELLNMIGCDLNAKAVVMDILTRHITRKVLSLNPVFFPSPQQWISNIAYSRLVVTDSFHCMAFAIIFKRDFIVIPSNKKLQGRMLSLLSDLGLENRLFDSVQSVTESRIWMERIDYVNVDKKLKKLRHDSMQYLQKALNA